MKNQWFLLSLLATFLSFISCSKDDPFPTDEEDDMSFVHSVTVGDNAYVSLFKDLNVEQTSTQNSLVFAKESFLFTYNGSDHHSSRCGAMHRKRSTHPSR